KAWAKRYLSKTTFKDVAGADEAIAEERAGKYLGKTVQIIPHVTGEIQRSILETSKGYEIQIVEIGGMACNTPVRT
ncbi:MAG: hypothetical protein EBT45_09075, partial [Alphaproteobacteria bacterium]|nr:hypothetical protein [Alphaproteobacteria bacterium]